MQKADDVVAGRLAQASAEKTITRALLSLLVSSARDAGRTLPSLFLIVN